MSNTVLLLIAFGFFVLSNILRLIQFFVTHKNTDKETGER